MISVVHWWLKNKALSQGIMKLVSKLFWFPWPGDLETRLKSLNIKLDLKIDVVHMLLKTEVKELWSNYPGFVFITA